MQLAISKTRKAELVAQYVDLIERSSAVFITEYTGLTVQETEELRGAIREADGAFYITKNTLIRVALEQTGQSVPDELLIGQTGVGFALGDAPPMAKVLTKFAKGQDKFVVRGGLMNEAELSADAVKSLAELPSLDELRAQLIGMIEGPARNIATVIAGGVRQVVNVIDAYAKKDENEAVAEAA